jgi:hypothetical protein
MHVIQYIAIKSDSVDNAHGSVKQYLETQLGNDPYSPTNAWFDWFVVGGGRWATNEDPYDDDWYGDVVHQDSPKFQEYLDTAHKYKLEATMDDLKYARKVDVAALLDKIENDQEGLYPMYSVTTELYAFYCLYKQLSGMWGPDSFYFDMEHDSTNLAHMKEAIDKGDNDWYLVPVDFHV